MIVRIIISLHAIYLTLPLDNNRVKKYSATNYQLFKYLTYDKIRQYDILIRIGIQDN